MLFRLNNCQLAIRIVKYNLKSIKMFGNISYNIIFHKTILKHKTTLSSNDTLLKFNMFEIY